jgi:FAD/FMN-containing dehydrogenase
VTAVIERATGLDGEAIALLRMSVRGAVITPDDADYDTARAVYNAMIDKRPALIVQCVDVADVMAAVTFAGDRDLPIAVRGGSHNAAGLGTCDDGIVIDLGRMNAVHVNPNTKRVLVEGGATSGDVDHATQPFGLAVPTGLISTTGVGGLALGGGFGYLSRKHGLTLDNLVAADMVLADGSFVTVSATERPDLFWAIRGGGGNFGVVTAFEFQAHEVGNVFAGVLFFEVEKSRELMELYRDFINTAPRELGLFYGTIFTPPAPFLPEEYHNKNMGKIVFCFNGSEEEGRKVIEPFLAVGPSAQFVGEFPFAFWNSAFDASFPAGRHDYWKADYISELTDEMIEIHLERGHNMPNSSSVMHIYSLNGAVQDVAPSATAYSHRDAKFVHVILMTDDDSDRMPDHIAFAREYWEALHPLSSGGAYVNFMMDEGVDRVKAVYRENYPQLQRIKAIYDPNNRFRVNQNITPKL